MKITKARVKEIIREELKESVRQGRRPLRQTDRPPSDDLYGYSKEAIEIRNQLEEFDLEMSLEPSEKERKDLVAKIKQMIPEKEKKVEQYRYTDREKRLKYEEEIKKLKRLRRRIQYYVSIMRELNWFWVLVSDPYVTSEDASLHARLGLLFWIHKIIMTIF